MTSITSVLSCNELLRMIFQELKPVYLGQEVLNTATPTEVEVCTIASRRQAQRDLASAARVCRAFTEHVLDALWEVLEGILPLLKVLPLYKSRSPPLDVFSRITTGDWDRLRSYSRRVKELHHNWRNVDCIRPSVLPILISKCGGTPLFPRLQRLKALSLNDETTAYTIPLLSATLQSVTVSFETYDDDLSTANRDDFEMMLSALHVTSPGLRELVLLEESGSTFNLDERHIKSLSDFPHLQRFASHVALDPAAWLKIGTLRSLHYLDIAIQQWGATSDTCSLALPDLQSLTLRGPLNVLAAFLGQLESPGLRSVSFMVHAYPSPTPASLGDFFNLTKDRLPYTLHKLAMNCKSGGKPWRGQDRLYASLKTFLTPLASFTQLDDLSLDLGEVAVHVSDDDIRTLSSALPRLVSLTLRYALGFHFAVPSGRPTIGALVALAAGCPHLTRLHLADLDIDADADSKSDASAEPAKNAEVSALDHNLRELEFVSFRTKTQQGVFDFAEKLDRLFPNLVNVRSRDAGAGSVGSGCQSSPWDVAKACLGFMQNARRNNRRVASVVVA
ncbi:hypothetical protein LXA43DRAFT_148083 [Ganoderma leucocontextum]|nr:hypothetical protein LXA43DRAFT_148083 [Ganoderma leucocontextum]